MKAALPAARSAPSSIAVSAVAGIAVTFLSAIVGAGLASAAAPFGESGPVVLLGVPVVLVMALATIGRPLIGALAVIGSFPVGLRSVPVGLVSLQVVEVAVLAVFVLVMLARLGRGQTAMPWSPALWWIAALTGWSLVALGSAVDETLAVKQIAQLVGGVLFAMVIMAACNNMREVRILLGGLVAAASAIALVTVSDLDAMTTVSNAATVHGRPTGTFDQPNQLGSFAAMATMVAAALALVARSVPARLAAAAALTVNVTALLLSLSRGAWIGALVAAAFLFAVLPQARRAVVLVALPLGVAALVAGAFAPQAPEVTVIGQRFESLAVVSPYDGRAAIWKEALREITIDPWTGHGPGGFPVASMKATSEANSVAPDHAHNLWLTWAAESGIPGALMIVGFTISMIVVTTRTTRRAAERDRTVVMGMAAALITVLGHGVVDYTLRQAVLFFALWTLIGALLAARRSVTTWPATDRPRATETLPATEA